MLLLVPEVEIGDIIELHSIPDLPIMLLHHFLQEKSFDIADASLGMGVGIVGIHRRQDTNQELLDIGSTDAIVDTLLEESYFLFGKHSIYGEGDLYVGDDLEVCYFFSISHRRIIFIFR